MKKLIGMSMLMLVIFIQNVNAQQTVKEGGNDEQIITPEAFATKWTEVLAAKLNLTEEQKIKVYAINFELFRTLSAEFETYKNQPEVLMEKKTVALDKAIEKVKSILTEDQLPLMVDVRSELDAALLEKKLNLSKPSKTADQ